MRRYTFVLDLPGDQRDALVAIDGFHRGSKVRWFLDGGCCTACVADELLDGTAEIVNVDEMRLASSQLRAGVFGGHRDVSAANVLDGLLRAWGQRGVTNAERLTVALEAAARTGGEMAGRMGAAIAAVLDTTRIGV